MNPNNGSKLNQQITVTSPPVPNQPSDVIASQSNGNGSKSNGNGSKSNGNGKFDQPVILRQSHNWSRGILWTIMGVTTSAIIWASVAKIEEAVPAQGKLEPQGAVNEVKAPVNGVVKEIYVKDGQRVKQGDLLLRLDPTAAQAQLASLSKVRTALIKENQFYRSAMSNPTSSALAQPELAQLQLPKEIASLTESRKALVAENQFYRTQLNGDFQGANLTPAQRARMQNARREVNSRIASAESEVEQLQKQLQQNQLQLENARKTLTVEKEILDRLELLQKEGGFAEIPVMERRSTVGKQQAEVDVRLEEKLRLELSIAQAKQKLENAKALTDKDLDDRIATNEKQIAEIDSQLNKLIVENEKKIAETDSQLSQTQVNLNYQELRAPVGGTVFDSKPSAPGFVANQTEPILKIVPDDTLVAKVFITNKDIGFVREGMPVDVRIDSFPYSEFGDVKGKLIWIGSDALPPEQIRPFYSFPAKIQLERQSLVINDKKVPLQSGMSISTNIRVRDRTVMSIFTDLFVDKTDSLKNVR
jgi:multidrug efflux pump subunit AcrA (membrane-fusion protein)